MTTGRLLHVLGGGRWQLPTVKRAKAMGLHVLVTDMYDERPAYSVADLHEVVDITDREATLDAARRHGIDAILCDTTDVGVPSAAYVAERLGLPGIGYEVALNCTDKSRMRSLVKNAGLDCPPFAKAERRDEAGAAAARLGYPLVVKPVDNQSGRGVSIIGEEASLDAAFDKALGFTRRGVVLLEGVVTGTEIIVDGFVDARGCHVLGIARKAPYPENPTVSSRILYESSWTLPCAEDRVVRTAAATAEALGLRRGIFHAEFMVSAERVVPIDFAARGGGVMIYTHVLPHVSGVDTHAAVIASALGEDPALAPRSTRRSANVEFFRTVPGVLDEVLGIDEALCVPGIAGVHVNLEPGKHTGSLDHKDDRLGFLVALGESTADSLAAAESAKSLLRVRLAGTDELQRVH